MKRHVVLVSPPAVERAGKVWEFIESRAVIVCADHEQAMVWADSAPPGPRVHAVTGLARTAGLLQDGRIEVLSGPPADLAALVGRSALKLDTLDTIVLAWPENFAGALDGLLAEAPDARRVILSWNPPALDELLERHARRPEIIGNLPLDADGKPLAPVGSARYAVTAAARRAATVRDVLDALGAVRPYVWTGGEIAVPRDADAVVAATLPSRDELQGLVGSGAGTPILLALAAQLPYLRSIAILTPVPLSTTGDRARDRAAELRAGIARRLRQGDVDAELTVLSPLFEEHDPALVAGALLALQTEGRGEKGEVRSGEPATSTDVWAKIFVSVGTKDRASAKDLVGALIKEAGLKKGEIGRIDVREKFSLVDVAAPVADQAVRRLGGVSIRGRRVTARPDRG